jgi:hypothetical protein
MRLLSIVNRFPLVEGDNGLAKHLGLLFRIWNAGRLAIVGELSGSTSNSKHRSARRLDIPKPVRCQNSLASPNIELGKSTTCKSKDGAAAAEGSTEESGNRTCRTGCEGGIFGDCASMNALHSLAYLAVGKSRHFSPSVPASRRNIAAS